jgi:hypothetical protein
VKTFSRSIMERYSDKRNKCMQYRWLILPLTAALIGVFSASAGAEDYRTSRVEYDVKAAFLYRTLKFIDWLEPPDSTTHNTITIGVYGQGPMLESLRTIEGKKVNNRKVVTVPLRDFADLASCDVIYIGPTSTDPVEERRNQEAVLAALAGKSILTVSDSQDFAENGGMIDFLIVDNKVRLEINPRAVKKANLRISSKLMRLATIVGDR